MSVIVQSWPCTFVVPGVEPVQGTVTFGWHPELPFLVRMDLTHPTQGVISWFLARDVIVECMIGDLNRPYGEGDYTIERGDVSGMITLANTESFAQITFFVEPLLRFVRDSLTVVPRGKSEDPAMGKLLDNWLETL